MILDNELRFSNEQAVTASAVSENIVDLGIADRDIGRGENLFLVVQCTEAMTDAGSDSTVAVTLETDDNTGLTSAVVLDTVGTFAALSAAGTRFVRRLPPSDNYERYLGVRYTVANGNLTTGKFTAAIVKDVNLDKVYPDNISIG
jgi:predicted permease